MDQVNDAQRGWLVWPRWGTVCGYLITLALSEAGVVMRVPAMPILLAAGVSVAWNLLAPGGRHPAVNAAGLVFDVCVLSLALYFTGGASNPLSALYLLLISLAAVTLRARWVWLLTSFCVVAFGLLFLAPSRTPVAHAHLSHPDADGFDLHLRGMWLAFALTAISVTYFVTRMTASLRAREQQLAAERERVQRAERVASVASLAASTAHELGTPLASIVLAAGEMRHALDRDGTRERLVRDIALIEGEARRCREILDAMLNEAGEANGEAPTYTDVAALLDDAIGALPRQMRARVVCDYPSGSPSVRVPRRLVVQSIHNLIRNALEASEAHEQVSVRAHLDGATLRFEVEDRGSGMSSQEVSEALQPFVSTKEGRGRGMGLFLARAVAERLGGGLELRSKVGEGTCAQLTVALDSLTWQDGTALGAQL